MIERAVLRIVATVCALILSGSLLTAQAADTATRLGSVARQQRPGIAATRTQGRILGIFDSESAAPVVGAEVVDLYAGVTARTPANGLIELSRFPSRHDSAAIRIRKIGFADTSLVVMVGPGDTVPMPIYLPRAAVTLAAVISEAEARKSSRPMGGLAEFTELANDKGAHPTIFSPVEMRRAEGRRLVDLLFGKGVGAVLRCPARGIRLYVDGVMQNDTGVPEGISTEQYEAAIYYPINDAPPRYRMTAKGCGVLILWSRQRVLP